MSGFVGRGLGLAGVLVGLLLALASPAIATPVTETPPNEDIATPFGPLASDVTYTGGFETLGDVDWLYFYVQPAATTVHVEVRKVGAGCSAQIRATVAEAHGTGLRTDMPVASDTTFQFDFNPAGGTRFYVKLAHAASAGAACVGDPYAVTVGPTAAITTVAPADDERPVPNPQPTLEPNDNVATASGPLAPSTAYGGDLGSPGDEDWMVFYTTGATPTRVSVTKLGGACSGFGLAYVMADTGEVMAAAELLFADTTADLTFAPTGPGRYYVSVSGCSGGRYQVRVGPSGAVTATSPLAAFAPTPSPVLTGEPNDTPARALRLIGGVGYGAAIDLPNDVDFFVFRVADGGQVEASITKIGEGCSNRLETSVRKAAAPGTVVAEHYVSRNATLRHRFISDGLNDYLLRISGSCAGDSYQLRIDPASVIVAPDRDGDGKFDDVDRCPTIAAASATGCPAKVRPRGIRLVLLPRRDVRRPFHFRVAGSIGLPAALPATAACHGRVAIRFRARGRSVAFASTPLRPDCKYGRTFEFSSRRSFGRARHLTVTATFRGNMLLRSAKRAAVARVR